MKITNLEDARALQRMGYPLDTPVEYREFSKEYTRHWVALMKCAFQVHAHRGQVLEVADACDVEENGPTLRRIDHIGEDVAAFRG